MLAKLKKVISNDGALFTISSLVFSFSTYLIALLIPYKLNIEVMADFSAVLNVVMILAFFFEFGLATSYLRFNQLYKSTEYVNVYFQIAIFILLLIFYITPLGEYIDGFFGLKDMSLNKSYMYLAIFALLSWMFLKNIYLSNKKIKFIFFNALVLLILRIVFLIYIFFQEDIPSVDDIFLYLFVIPFLFIAIFNIKNSFFYLKESFLLIREIRYREIFFKRFRQLLIFSVYTYFIGLIYIYASRYVLVYLTEENMTTILAELGYAFSFGGLIMVFLVSIRLFLISKFNISDKEAILVYIKKIQGFKYHFFFIVLFISLAISYCVWLIKPEYLSIRSIYFLFMIIFSYGLIMYNSMITLLAKTFNFNQIELMLNIVRLVLVVVSVKLIFKISPIYGFALFSAIMVLIEYIFAKIVLMKILNKETKTYVETI